MYKVTLRKTKRLKRKIGIRQTISGDAVKPRLSVFRSNKYIYAQLIDDTVGKTLISASSEKLKGKKTEAAKQTGKTIAELALKKGIKTAVFDRNGFRFHGRVKSLADAAREGGLKL